MAELINKQILEKAFLSYNPKFNYIADEILTLVNVSQSGENYNIYDSFSLKPEDDIEGNSGAKIVEDTVRAVQRASYSTISRGLKSFIKDEDRKSMNDAELFDLLLDKIGAIKEKLLLNKEIRVANLIENNGNSTSPTTKWDASNPTIEKDIREAIASFEDYAGITPNLIIIPKPVWDTMVMDETLRNVWLLVPSSADKNKIKLSSLLNMLFDNFEKIIIPNAKKDTTKKGKAQSLSYVWTSDTVALLYYAPIGTRETFTWGANFKYQDFKIRQWREEDPEGVWVKVSYQTDEKVVCSNAIYKLTDVLT